MFVCYYDVNERCLGANEEPPQYFNRKTRFKLNTYEQEFPIHIIYDLTATWHTLNRAD